MTAAQPAPPLAGLVPTACQLTCPVQEQVLLARETFRLRLEAPELARQVLPGQFFMLRDPSTTQPLLGRPFALYDTVLNPAGQPVGIDLVYLVVGRMTERLAALRPGDEVSLWGPLGNGFPLPPRKRLVMVAGGIGYTPFLAVAREARELRTYGHPPRRLDSAPASVVFCYGARSAEYLAGLDDFAAAGVDVRISTDNGSRGHRGYVTDLLAEELARSEPRDTAVFCCGPEPMMHAVSELTARHDVPCWLSLETPMACGFGACFSCVTRVRLPDGGWDYRRVCVEGPIFPSHQILL